MADDTIINIDLSKLEKELALQNDLKIQELKMYADELKADNKVTDKEYGAYIKKINSFKK